MYRSKVYLSFGFLATLAFILSSVTVTKAKTKELPPFYGEHLTAGFIEGLAINQGRAASVLDYRLPNTTEPIHYDIDLTTNVHNGTKMFTGSVTIQIKVKETTRTIVLHKRQTTILKAIIKDASKPDAVAENLTFSYEEIREFLSLTPTSQTLTFNRGTNWNLTIDYEGNLRGDNAGFYLSTYTDLSGNERYLATTQFESTDARHAFPCYDEPAKRATFSVIIKHSVSYNAISNMPLDEKASTPGYSVFQKTVNMPTYLVAFIVSDFEYTEGVLNARPQRIYSRPGTTHNQEWALLSGMLLLQRLADYYEVDFALPKIYQVAVPDFAAGAMENWGLATYREEYILWNKDESTTSTQTNIAETIAHEYCHQWFGDLVTPKWWTYLWLKEGFATLFSYQATNAAYPEWDVYQRFLVNDFQRALAADGTGKLPPMTHYVQTPSEISSRYDSISYSKAGSVLYMWQNAVTDDIFRQGLNIYLTKNQFGAAEEDQLFTALSIAAGANNIALPATIKAMFSSWSHQRTYPALTVKRDYSKKSFTITQEAFYDNKDQKSSQTWYIPLNYAHQGNPDYRNTTASHFMLKAKQIVISDENLGADDWLMLNKQSTGFYRINYDEQNWKLIINALKLRPYKFHPRNRAQFINDAYKFSTTGSLNQNLLFDMLQYLPLEDQYAPWSTASAIITTFDKYLSGDGDYKNFQAFVASLVEGLFDKLAVYDISGEQHLNKYTRNIAINLACLAGIKNCLEETNNKLKAFIYNGVAIEPNLQSPIYCNGLRQSGDAEFDNVYNYVLQSNDQAFRRTLVAALGCSEKESQLRKFVRSSIDMSTEWRVQERITLLSSAYSRSNTGLLVSIDFLNDHWEEYASLTAGFGGANPLNADMLGISNYVVNREQEYKYLTLLEKVKRSDKVQATLEQSAKTNMQANFDWLNANRNSIMSYVSTYAKAGSATLRASFLTIFAALLVAVARY
ncbi:aminopeptidase N [Eurosta solidaginis]|uniref:aminopeptidase N n=1 Tax=Eurosta solidaginis TaxID=178769 RepID=UPI0035314098